MSDLNPYDKFLDGRPLETILRATPAEIAHHLDAIGLEKSTLPPAPGKWSPAEIVAHLADCELVFGYRLRQTLADHHPTIQPFDQARWAERYANHDFASALRLFDAARAWNLILITPPPPPPPPPPTPPPRFNISR